MEIEGNRIILEERHIGERARIINMIDKVITEGYKDITVDMHKVTFMDSIAIGDLVKSALVCRQQGINFIIENYNSDIKRSLVYSGLSEIFHIASN